MGTDNPNPYASPQAVDEVVPTAFFGRLIDHTTNHATLSEFRRKNAAATKLPPQTAGLSVAAVMHARQKQSASISLARVTFCFAALNR